MTPDAKHRELLVAACMTGASLVALALAARLPGSGRLDANGGPRLIPVIASAIMVMLSVLRACKYIPFGALFRPVCLRLRAPERLARKSRAHQNAVPENSAAPDHTYQGTPARPARLRAMLAMLALYALVLESAGFALSTFLLIAVVSPLFGLNGLKGVILFSFLATAGTWALFAGIFGCYLPPGTWF